MINLKQAVRIIEESKNYRRLDDRYIKNEYNELKKFYRYSNWQKRDESLLKLYSFIVEAVYRVKHIELHPVQIYGGDYIKENNIAEIKTGEGKTYVLLFPIIYQHMMNKNVHVATTNEYLASRDLEDLEPILKMFGISSSVIRNEMDKEAKEEAYKCDVIFSTLNNFAFDYLRDNLVLNIQDKIQNNLEFLLLDEVDYLAIDESETPIIIAEEKPFNESILGLAQQVITHCGRDLFEVDDIKKKCSITQEGIQKIESYLDINNLYDGDNQELVKNIHLLLEAEHFYKKGRDYIVKDNKLFLVDIGTGRVMDGKKFGNGLHQSLELKEEIPVTNETNTKAFISTYSFIRNYQGLSGVSGTAYSDNEVFQKLYQTNVKKIPTHKKSKRIDLQDHYRLTKDEKILDIYKYAKKKCEDGQPVLIGAYDVRESEELSKLFDEKGLKHLLLNANNEEDEKRIIGNAGDASQIIISTNMVGRGTDIKTSNEVERDGGLVVIGSQRNLIDRVDEQLKGRAGRQGKNGESVFFVSLEDEIFTQVENERERERIEELKKIKNDKKLKRKAQKLFNRVKRTIREDRITNREKMMVFENQIEMIRKDIYKIRNSILLEEYTKIFTRSLMEKWTKLMVDSGEENKILALLSCKLEEIEDETKDEKTKRLNTIVLNIYETIRDNHRDESLDEVERHIYVHLIDKYWSLFLEDYLLLRENMHLRSYGYEDVFRHFQQELEKMYLYLQEGILKDYCEEIILSFYKK